MFLDELTRLISIVSNKHNMIGQTASDLFALPMIPRKGAYMASQDFLSAYTAVDVETPNRYSRSLCSIGIVHVEPNAEPICQHYLVDPEDEFDGINISIHGIHPEDVDGKKTFPEVWTEISHWFSNGILLAHNAVFDLSVIQRSLERYELPVPDMYYVCTLQKARRHIDKQAFGNHKLNTLCEGLALPLEQHHNALSDAYACAALFEYLKNHYGCDESDVCAFRITPQRERHDKNAQAEKALNTLHGLLLGIGYDRVILPVENQVLLSWIRENQHSANGDILACRRQLQLALEDGIITLCEHESLLGLSKTAVACGAQYCITTQATQLLMGVLNGIGCDKRINDMEAERLLNWMDDYSYLRGFYLYDKVFDTLMPMMADRHIDPDEEAKLLTLINQVLHPVHVELAIEYEGNAFCLTGNFTHGSKEEIGAFIESRGGTIAKGVSKKVQYVIVGGAGSEKWAYGNYGSKVKKALELIDQGCGIRIAGEDGLFDDG